MNGMARQPEAIGRLQVVMLIALAFVELVYLLTVFVVPGSYRTANAPYTVEAGANAPAP
jgi:F-type H+-transporting ATPase subunit c